MKNILILTSLSMLLLGISCGSKKDDKEKDVEFLVTNPLRQDTLIYKEYVCQIRAIQHIELRALEEGYLQHILVDEGQLVKKGQLLFKILPTVYEAEMQKAQAEVDLITIEYLNTKKLADSNVVSKTELAMTKARLDKAKAELALTQTRLKFTDIKAPFDGIVGRFNEVRLGSLLDRGDLLTTLSENSKMWVYFNVPEAEYLDYMSRDKSKQPLDVKLKMANNQLFEQSGKIETIESDFNNETGNIAFRAAFLNPKRILRHGETGNIEMPIPLPKVLLIPQKSTFEVLDKKYVFVVDKQGVVKTRQITIGVEMPHLYVVKEGLTEGDQILLEGLRKVKENDKITYKHLEASSVLSHLSLYAE